MVHISKKKLKKETEREMRMRFAKTMIDLKKTGGVSLLEELFTETEHIMFMKRLAALMLLAEGFTPFRVSRLLKISPTTANRFSEEILDGRYEHIVVMATKKREREAFWKDLEVLLRLGMPELGKNRWKWLDEVYPE